MKPWATSCGATGRFSRERFRDPPGSAAGHPIPQTLGPAQRYPGSGPDRSPLPGGRSHVLPCYDSDRRTDDCAGRAGQKAPFTASGITFPSSVFPESRS